MFISPSAEWGHSGVGGRYDGVCGRTLKTIHTTYAGQAALGWSNRTETPQIGDSPILTRTSKPKLPGKPSAVPKSQAAVRTHSLVTLSP